MRYSLYTDGSHLQYVNEAGIGGYLLNEQGEKIWEFSEKLPQGLDFNQHEAYALEYGLKKCITTGVKDVDCFLDFNGLVNKLNIKDFEKLNEFAKCHEAVKGLLPLLDYFENINFFYLPREENKLADKLSRKKITMNISDRSQIVEGAFQHPNLFCTHQFSVKNKPEFKEIKSDVNHHYLFNFKFSDKGHQLEVHKMERYPEIKVVDVKTYSLDKNWLPHYVRVVHKVLNESNESNIGLIFLPGTNEVPETLRGLTPISRRSRVAFENLSKVIPKFEKVVIHDDNALIKVALPPIFDYGTRPKTLEDEEKMLIDALKILANPAYEIGSNPKIEARFPLSEEKSKSVVEIQKKYFGELMKVEAKMQGKKERENREIITRVNAEDVKQKIFDRMERMRQKLESQGIKLKIK